MLVSGMIVQGTTKGPHFGPFAVGKPNERDLQRARDLGVRVAELTKALFA
jgi:NAD(P)H dehydrogenase (quinone)